MEYYGLLQAKLEAFLKENGYALTSMEMSTDSDCMHILGERDPFVTNRGVRLTIEALQCADLPREPKAEPETPRRDHLLDSITTPL